MTFLWIILTLIHYFECSFVYNENRSSWRRFGACFWYWGAFWVGFNKKYVENRVKIAPETCKWQIILIVVVHPSSTLPGSMVLNFLIMALDARTGPMLPASCQNRPSSGTMLLYLLRIYTCIYTNMITWDFCTLFAVVTKLNSTCRFQIINS